MLFVVAVPHVCAIIPVRAHGHRDGARQQRSMRDIVLCAGVIINSEDSHLIGIEPSKSLQMLKLSSMGGACARARVRVFSIAELRHPRHLCSVWWLKFCPR